MKDWENDDKGIKNNDDDHINHKNDGLKRGGKSVRRQIPLQQNATEHNTRHDTTRHETQYNTIQ